MVRTTCSAASWTFAGKLQLLPVGIGYIMSVGKGVLDDMNSAQDPPNPLELFC